MHLIAPGTFSNYKVVQKDLKIQRVGRQYLWHCNTCRLNIHYLWYKMILNHRAVNCLCYQHFVDWNSSLNHKAVVNLKKVFCQMHVLIFVLLDALKK